MPSVEKDARFRARVLVWADLSLDNIDEILKCESAQQIQSLLGDIFDIKDFESDLKSGVLVDLYFYTLQFAKDNEFTKEQTSAFFSMVKAVHCMAVDTPYGNVEPVFDYFKELLLCHSVKRPPFSIALFSVDQVKKITTYVISTYFRHFKMYKYAFTPKVRLDLSMEYVGLPETPVPSEGEQEDTAGVEFNEASGEAKNGEDGLQEEEIEETPAVKELKAIITTALNEQVQQLKTTVEQQIKTKDEEIAKKMGLSPNDVGGPPKSPRGKGKRGK